MKFKQGDLVKYDDNIVGTVAGQYDPINYGPDLYTIIVDEDYKTNFEKLFGKTAAWFWNEWCSPDHPLTPICKDKYCFNIRESNLSLAITKLGNRL